MAREVLWGGVLYGQNGYARANRRLCFACVPTIRVQAHPHPQLGVVDHTPPVELAILRSLAQVEVSERAPALWVSGPNGRRSDVRYSILYTMMETRRLHEDFAARLKGYDEIWAPTSWNLSQFGQAAPGAVLRRVPLGVDPFVFRPEGDERMFPARLLTTERAGAVEVPEGFLVATLSLPSFRKGFDFAVQACEAAFGDHPADVALILMTTFHRGGVEEAVPGLREILGKARIRVYQLGFDGDFIDDWSLAALYRACHVYLAPSRGEGFDLPLFEAAACGLPVVASGIDAHVEYLTDEDAWIYPIEGYSTYPGAERISPWYDGQEFARFGKRSLEAAVEALREIYDRPIQASEKAGAFSRRVRSQFTWEAASSIILDRILEV